MGDRRDGDRGRALDDVGEAVDACLAALDRHERAFAHVLSVPAAPVGRRSVSAGAAAGWDDVLAVARARAAEAEELLTREAAHWGRWRDSLAAWRQSVEQSPAAAG